MQITPLKRSSASCSWLARRAPDIIDALGKPEFESRLFSATRSAVGCDLLQAVALGGCGEKQLLFVADSFPSARQAGGLRQALPDREFDAVLDTGTAEDAFDVGALIRGPIDDPRTVLRRSRGAGEALGRRGSMQFERVGLIRRHKDSLICISLYRHQQMGPFEPAELQRLEDAAELIIALIAKHRALLPTGEGPADQRRHYMNLLSQIGPNLSQREREVCACIAAGLSSEAIALTLDIKLNTVLTHRKHAYNRLNISSQNELLRKVLITSQLIAARRHNQSELAQDLSVDRSQALPIAAPAA